MVASQAAEQSQVNLELIRKQNSYIATLRQVLQELKVFDEVAKRHDAAIAHERDAQRAVILAEDRRDKVTLCLVVCWANHSIGRPAPSPTLSS